MTAPASVFDLAPPPAGAEPSTAQRIENELARRIFRVVAVADFVLLSLYFALCGVRAHWIMAGALAAQFLPLAWALAIEAPRGRHARALRIVFWPLFAMMSALAVAEGGLLGTTAWWLVLPPVALIQAGATRSGLAMTIIGAGELLASHELHAAGILPTLDDRLLGPLQMPLAVVGATFTVAGLVWIGVRWRRELLLALDALRADAEEATRVKTRFIANMSHEIRTPLNGIVGAADLLRLSGLDAAQQQATQIIDHSAQALLAVVNDVLDFAKIEAGRVELEHIGLDPAALAYDTAETFAGQAHARGVELWAHASLAVPALIHSDPVRMRQILHNLVSNAMKFTEAGEIRIAVDLVAGTPAVAGDPSVPELRFAVRDTGIGLDAQQKARLFQAFMQGDLSTTRRFGGTGLGLVICRELAHLMGGRLELESEPGVGSTFSFILPLPHLAREALPSTHDERPRIPRATLVVCCTSPTLVRDLQDWAERADYRVEATTHGTPDDWLALARGIDSDTLLVDDDALRAAGLSRGTWGARMREAGMKGVLLLGVSVPVVSVPDGLVPLYKPARPLRLEGALREAQRGYAPRRDAMQAPSPVRVEATSVDHIVAAPRATVLLVEDNPVNQAVARALLAQLRVEAVVAEDGGVALRLLESSADDYAVVLMDCHMPVVDGFEATRAWRRRENSQGRRRLPVIAMTANSIADAGAECSAAGMDDFLSKPFSLGELERVLERWLDEPHDAREARASVG
ncbi:MAG TPA: ATP-binding protein [Burkholderiaceae bacterium]|nr:ATP-binding protein [Burkholderiaceae bacterium]